MLVAAFVWRGGAALGLLPGHHMRPAALVVVVLLGLFELARLLEAAVSLSKHRQLRTAFRFATAIRGELRGRPCLVEDLSSSGCAIVLESLIELRPGLDLRLDLGVFGRHGFILENPRFSESPEALRIHARLTPVDEYARNALAAALFIVAPTLEKASDHDLRDARASALASRLRAAGALGDTVASTPASLALA
jgi:hypothetical protein